MNRARSKSSSADSDRRHMYDSPRREPPTRAHHEATARRRCTRKDSATGTLFFYLFRLDPSLKAYFKNLIVSGYSQSSPLLFALSAPMIGNAIPAMISPNIGINPMRKTK